MSIRRSVRSAGLSAAAILVLAGAGTASAALLQAPPKPAFTPNLRADAAEGSATGQNEPQVTVDQSGLAYVTWQGSPQTTGLATTRYGRAFTYRGSPDHGNPDLGDVAMATTSWPRPRVDVPAGPAGENAAVWTDLGATACGGPINMRGATSLDGGATWRAVDATCQPFQVDRNWTAAYTEPAYRGTAQAAAHTWVYDEYHDFVASNIWVTVSADGGATYSPVQHSAIQPGSAAVASACNTIPGGVAVDQRGAHRGRVYVVWQSSDLISNAQGCNYTQAQPFDHIFVSSSDDHGVTWTTHSVYNDPCAPNPPAPPANPGACQDTSELFTPVAVDDAGNVYVAFARREPGPGGAQPEYDVVLAWSTDGGRSFNGGTVDHPGLPRRVNADTGTHYFPWLAAGGNGGVDVVWYRTPYVEGTGFNNKPAAAPGSAAWNVFMAQSLNVPGGGPFTQAQVTTHPNYFGDICTTGIFCGLAPATFNWGEDRILLDDFGVAVGPDGGARIAWTDSRDSWTGSCQPGGSSVSCQRTHVYFACQSSGLGVNGDLVSGCGRSTVPARSSTALISPAGLLGFLVAPAAAGVRRRALPGACRGAMPAR